MGSDDCHNAFSCFRNMDRGRSFTSPNFSIWTIISHSLQTWLKNSSKTQQSTTSNPCSRLPLQLLLQPSTTSLHPVQLTNRLTTNMPDWSFNFMTSRKLSQSSMWLLRPATSSDTTLRCSTFTTESSSSFTLLNKMRRSSLPKIFTWAISSMSFILMTLKLPTKQLWKGSSPLNDHLRLFLQSFYISN